MSATSEVTIVAVSTLGAMFAGWSVLKGKKVDADVTMASTTTKANEALLKSLQEELDDLRKELTTTREDMRKTWVRVIECEQHRAEELAIMASLKHQIMILQASIHSDP